MISSPNVVPDRRGTIVVVAALLLSACAGAAARSADDGSSFLARQYFQRGRAAWAAGNEANARFLLARAVELDPGSEALAFWTARWPADSLPAAAREALARAGTAAPVVAAGADAGAPDSSSVVAAPADTLTPRSTAGAGDAAGAQSEVVDPVAALAEADVAAARAGEGGAEPPPPPGPAVAGEELGARRAAFESARASGRAAALLEAGRRLIEAWPQHLPTVHRVLGSWVDARAEPAATEQRIRDLLASLEFGDTDYLAGKPEDVTDAAWLRVWRGRFLDLLGWSAFLRGDLAPAEAALRSAENEINLRGRGDVTHLRHLASFYERRGDLRRAEAYAIAAAARDEGGSGEVRAAAARLWTRRHGSTAALEARLRSEAERVRREERAAAVADRLYAPLPAFSARPADGTAITDESLRGPVTVVVVWEPGCDDCVELLRSLAQEPPGTGTAQGRGRAPVRVLALDVGGDPAAARAAAAGLTGVTLASVAEPKPFVRSLGSATLPVTLVVEPAGFIQYRHAGYPDETGARQRWRTRLEWQVEGLRGLSADARRGAGARRTGGRSAPPGVR